MDYFNKWLYHLVILVIEASAEPRWSMRKPEAPINKGTFSPIIRWENMKLSDEYVYKKQSGVRSLIECGAVCASKPYCGSFSYSPFECLCLMSKYTIYGPGLAVNDTEWTLVTRAKGIGLYRSLEDDAQETEYTMTNAQASVFCQSLGGRLATHDEMREFLAVVYPGCKAGHTENECYVPCKPASHPNCCHTLGFLRWKGNTQTCDAWCTIETQATELVFAYPLQ